MAREWQQTRFKEFVMPDAVYYQTLWAVRDLERLEKKYEQMKEETLKSFKGSQEIKESQRDYRKVNPTEQKAVEMVILNERIEGIRTALEMVPEKYRKYVLSNIILKNPGSSFPDKLWRIWKQRFLFNVAKNLTLF